MTLVAVGLSHRTAPMDVLERAAAGPDDVPELLAELVGRDDVLEALLLSTCNRVEVYAAVETFHGGLAEVSAVLARHAGMDVDDLAGHLYVHHEGAAVEHLFRVAAGLDSMVLGEPQILGQLRDAYATADRHGAAAGVVHDLAQQALRVGKQVHSRTRIDSAGRSVVSEALTDATAVLGGLHGRRALIIGAGSLAGLAAAELRRRGAGGLTVANRTPATAQRLARRVAADGMPARAVPLDAVPAELATADLVIACTGAREAVLTAATVAAAMRSPMVICDLALPRDVDIAVRDLPGVTLVDLEGLARRLRDAEAGTSVEAAESLIAEGVRHYLASRSAAAVVPTVTALRRHASEVVDAELLRLRARLPELPEGVRAELARTVHRVVNTLLHAPTVRVRQLADGPVGGTYPEALRELFGLDVDTDLAPAG